VANGSSQFTGLGRFNGVTIVVCDGAMAGANACNAVTVWLALDSLTPALKKRYHQNRNKKSIQSKRSPHKQQQKNDCPQFQWNDCDEAEHDVPPVNCCTIDFIVINRSPVLLSTALFLEPSRLHLTVLMVALLQSGRRGIQESIIEKSKGDPSRIDDLVAEAEEGAFDVRRCGGRVGCEIVGDIIEGEITRSDSCNSIRMARNTLSAVCSFVNYDINRKKFIDGEPSHRTHVDAVFSLVDEFSGKPVRERSDVTTPMRSVLTPGHVTERKNGALTLECMDYNVGELPERFGGTSGGGLWRMYLNQSDDGSYEHVQTRLCGVASFQRDATHIVCQGFERIEQALIPAIRRHSIE